MRWLILIFWLAVCFSVAAIGARWNASEIKGWYRELRRPSFAPPNWVFGPVWSLLYLMMAIAAWRISMEPASTARTWALGLFVLQLALNLAWSYIFFRRHAIGWALAEILLLWAAIGATAYVFGRVNPLAGWLMAPYLAWVSFASLLNAGFWRLARSGS
jgi:tryptophan-rich sensory protein